MKKKVSFVDVRHDLLVEWNYERDEGLEPQAFAANSHRKVWWMCSSGHEWEASIASRVRGMGCPYDCCKLFMMPIGFDEVQQETTAIEVQINA